jgi:steroid 5-alpha reductase family enzyme
MGRTASFAHVTLAYAVATAAAVWSFQAFPLMSADPVWGPWAQAAMADGVATLVIFGFSRLHNNSSMYDAYWSVAPMVFAPGLVLGAVGPAGEGLRVAAVLAVVLLWGARLTLNWATGWSGLHHEDWRYVDLRAQTGRAYWLVSLLGLHGFPTVQVLLGMLPLGPALLAGGARPFGALDALALAIGLGSVAVEAVADLQLRAHQAAGRGGVIDTGLWAWCRHPNYLGEIGFWVSLWVFALGADPGSAWTGVGALAILLMFVFVSIPMMERRQRARKPAFEAYAQRVPMILPRPPR